MANQYSDRPDGSLVNLKFNFAGLRRMAVQRIGQMKRADTPILETHHYFGQYVQDYIADELKRAIKAHGRAQRGDRALLAAIVDPRNRHVNLDGFTVGYLDEAWAGEVRKYWRGVEAGTAVHVGRFLRGSFLSAGGHLVRPIEGGKDPRFLQFGPIGPLQANGSFTTAANQRNGLHQGNSQGPRMASGHFTSKGAPGQGQIPGVRIKNQIVGYHYFKRGKEAWNADFPPQARIESYIRFFDAAGIDFLARAMSRGLTGSGSLEGYGLTTKPAPREAGR